MYTVDVYNAITKAAHVKQKIENFSKTRMEKAYDIDRFHGEFVGIRCAYEDVKHTTLYEYNVDETHVHCMVHEMANGPPVKLLMCFLNTCICVMNILAGKRDDVNVTFALHDINKLHPIDEDAYKSEHINNGVTITYASGAKEIYIYRLEDYEKVLIHELIHLYEYDFGARRPNDSFYHMYCIQDIGNIGCVDLNEAYTEALACYLYICISVHTKSRKDFISRVNECVSSSNKFFLSVANGLLQSKHRDSTTGKCRSHLRQETNVFAYYIGKAAIFYHMGKFLKILERPHNKRPVDMIEKFIVACISCPRFVSSMKASRPSQSLTMSPIIVKK